MHIAFTTEMNIKIDGFSNFSGTTDIPVNYLGRGTVGSTTYACYPRFGAFNAYSTLYDTGTGQITNMSSFLLATASVCTRLGIPMIETSSTLSTRLLTSYAMPLNADAAIAYYASSGTGMTVNEGTVISTYTVTYPTTFLKNFTRSQTFLNTNLVPIALYQSRYPWSGYNTTSGPANGSLPSGFFVDPSSGLPILGNNVSTPPAVTIRFAASGKKYVSVDASTIAWTIGGIRGTGNPVTPYNSAAFGGTLFDLTNTGTALMTSAIAEIKYTAVSWIGCAFHNNGCLLPVIGAKQSFIWSGFYCGGSVASASGLMNTYHSVTGGKIVWDLAAANGETTNYTSATYVTYASPPHNILMWTPLPGTNPTDRDTVHIFTMLINNQASISNNASIDSWVQLYQNGVKLSRVSVQSTNLRATYEASPAKMMNNVLFTQVPDSTALGNLFSGNAQVGGAPVANAYAQAVAGTKWAFAANNVQTQLTVYNEAQVVTLATTLAFDWGIVPMITGSTDLFVLNWVGIGGINVTGKVSLSRIGFFVNVAEAVAGTNDVSLITGGISSFGFATSADWTTVDASGDWENNRSAFYKSTGSSGDIMDFNTGTNPRVVSSIASGAFMRLNMTWIPLASVDARGVRLFLRMRHDNFVYSYGLGFSYNGIAYNTALNAFMDSSGTMLAYKGIYRLVLLTKTQSIEWPDRGYALTSPYSAFEWSNPYTSTMDSMSPAVVFADVQTFANGGSVTAFSEPFLASYYTVRDLGANTATWKRWYRSANAAGLTSTTLSNIPSWENTINANVGNPQASFDVSLTPFPMSTGTAGVEGDQTYPWGNGLRMAESLVRGHLSRMWWTYTTPIAINALMFYQSFPGTFSEYVKFEVVASNDMINFVRIPTMWGVTLGSQSTETYDTFSFKHNRIDINGRYAWYVASDISPVYSSKGVSAADWATRYNNKFFLTSSGTSAVFCIVRLVNATAYKYYGFGNVGSDTPYSSNSRVVASTDARSYARMPFGTFLYTTGSWSWAYENNNDYGSIALDADRPETLYPWARSNGNKNFCLPQKCVASVYNSTQLYTLNDAVTYSGSSWVRTALNGTNVGDTPVLGSSYWSVSPPIVYKYWRIRATSAFFGACGSTTKAYFWKLGLYRDAVAAAADTYGLSSNNYIQQWTNVVAVSTNGSTPTSVTELVKNQICVSLGDWTQTYSTSSGGVSGADALQNNAVAVAFQSELACVQFTLDVVGHIGAIRFPDNMYYDTNVRGGTFIIEASNTPLVSTSWVAMVATSTTSSGKLGREGILNAIPVASGNSGNQALDANFKIFTIVPAAGSYTWPTLGTLTIPGGNLMNMTRRTGITVIITGGTSTNTTLDFNVHGIISSGVAPTLGSSTKFNCIVTSYALVSSDYTLTFEYTPTFSGSCKFVVYVRSGEGTGVLGTTGVLISSSVTIDSPPISGNPVIDIVIGDWVKANTIPNTGSIGGVGSFLQATGYPLGYATLNDYQTESIFGKKAIHFYANRAAGQGGGPGNGDNNSGISLPRANVQTVSFWFHIPYRTNAAYPSALSTWWLDGGDDGAGYRRPIPPYNYHRIAPPNGIYENLIHYYMNGGPSSVAFGSLMQLTLDTTTSWQHITFVFNSSIDTPRLRLFSDCRPMSGVDCYIGRLTVWDFAINRTQNDQNYAAGF
jgi:hypothetical protein